MLKALQGAVTAAHVDSWTSRREAQVGGMKPAGAPLIALFLACARFNAVTLFADESASDATSGSASGGQAVSELNTQGVRAAQQGQWELGVGYLRRAVKVNPRDVLLRQNLSGILTDWAIQLERSGDAAQAERLLLEAVTDDPDNGVAFVRLGDLAYFRRSDFSGAIASWKRANGKLSPAEWRAVADRISQAQRDATIEQDFVSEGTEHFDIRLSHRGTADLEALGRLLETAYAALVEQLGSGPSKLTVIVYTERDMRRTYYQRDWALGFYDGRLRLLGRELGTDVAPMMVAHELAHAFLQHAYGPALPIWVHEGFAQLQERDPSTRPPAEAGGLAQDVAPAGLRQPRTDDELRLEEAVAGGDAWVPLKWLDRRFAQPSYREDVGRAYVQARLVVAELIRRRGVARFKTFLDAVAKGTPVDAAYDAAFAPDHWAETDRPILK